MKSKIILTAIVVFALPLVAAAELPSVKLKVSGIDPAAGTVEATLFNSAQDFLLDAFLQRSGDVSEDGTFEAEFIGLDEGDYAIVVVHDANDNGVFDAGLLGFGGESVGYSNNASSLIGRPSFDDAKFTLVNGEETIEIILD